MVGACVERHVNHPIRGLRVVLHKAVDGGRIFVILWTNDKFRPIVTQVFAHLVEQVEVALFGFRVECGFQYPVLINVSRVRLGVDCRCVIAIGGEGEAIVAGVVGLKLEFIIIGIVDGRKLGQCRTNDLRCTFYHARNGIERGSSIAQIEYIVFIANRLGSIVGQGEGNARMVRIVVVAKGEEGNGLVSIARSTERVVSIF